MVAIGAFSAETGAHWCYGVQKAETVLLAEVTNKYLR